MPIEAHPSITVRALDATEAAARLGELAAILLDAVAHGASVNFLAGLDHGAAQAFWRGHLPGIAARDRQLLVADDGRRLVATALLVLAQQPNQPHRADVGKMLVLSGSRRQGIARRLLGAVEAAARANGRSLLMLDTQSGSAADGLYRACGWTAFGVVPGHALLPDGEPADTTFFFKRLA